MQFGRFAPSETDPSELISRVETFCRLRLVPVAVGLDLLHHQAAYERVGRPIGDPLTNSMIKACESLQGIIERIDSCIDIKGYLKEYGFHTSVSNLKAFTYDVIDMFNARDWLTLVDFTVRDSDRLASVGIYEYAEVSRLLRQLREESQQFVRQFSRYAGYSPKEYIFTGGSSVYSVPNLW